MSSISPNPTSSTYIAKALAILSVLFLHFLAIFPSHIYTQSPYKWIFLTLNQATRFNVPLFLALSGFGLARKYSPSQTSPKHFLSQRLQKLLPQYIFWSTIIYFTLLLTSWQLENPSLLPDILFGFTDYHLYFIPLLIQLYLLYAFLPSLNHARLKTLVVFSGLLQLSWFIFTRHLSTQISLPALLDDQLQYRLLINWLFYFVLGIFLAHLNLTKLRSHPLFLPSTITGTLISLVWATTDAHHLYTTTSNLIYATSFIRTPIFLYATCSILIIITLQPLFQRLPKTLSKFLVFTGRHSYLIYLSHTLGLRLLFEIFSGVPHPSSFTLAGGTFITATLISYRFS